MNSRLTKSIFISNRSFAVFFIVALFAGVLWIEELCAIKPPPTPPPPVIPPVTCNCYVPPFISNQAKPNVLIILDNSNSMDEDFYGGAVGSFSPASKSEMARSYLKTFYHTDERYTADWLDDLSASLGRDGVVCPQ